eukprot:285527-Hanusia_phi.AAC.1
MSSTKSVKLIRDFNKDFGKFLPRHRVRDTVASDFQPDHPFKMLLQSYYRSNHAIVPHTEWSCASPKDLPTSTSLLRRKLRS